MSPNNSPYMATCGYGCFVQIPGASFHCESDTISDNKGSYALILSLDHEIQCEIGRLGPRHFPSGIYGYAGNAYGGGGLRARLRRHFASDGPTHWHIDYLKPVATLLGAWLFDQGCECDVADAMLSMPRACLPVDGFGASDCKRCHSHLILLEER